MGDTGSDCRVFWGSHGCDRKRGHDGPHECWTLDLESPKDGEYVVCSTFRIDDADVGIGVGSVAFNGDEDNRRNGLAFGEDVPGWKERASTVGMWPFPHSKEDVQ